MQVEADPFLEIDDLVAAADLPKAGEAGFDAEATAVGEVAEAFDFVHGQRTGADQAHVAAQDVPELREFIEAVFAEELADGGDSGVVCDFKNGAAHFVHGLELMLVLFGVGYHRPEFIEGKRPAVLSGTLLAEEDGAAGGNFDGDGNGGKYKYTKKSEQNERTREIQDRFGDAVPGGFGGGAKDEEWAAEEFVNAGAGDLGCKEVGHEPDLNPLEFTGFDDVFYLIEEGMAGPQNDTIS